MRHTKRKPEIKIGHLMLCKACELSERVKSRSPESNILEEHREEKKPGPESRRGIRVQRRGMEVQTTEKGNQKRRKTRERETESVALAFSSLSLMWASPCLFTLGESLVTVTRKRYMDAVMPAIMNSSKPWRGLPYMDNRACGHSQATSGPRSNREPSPLDADTADLC